VRTDGDLAFVKDNATIQEVNLARVYNWDVKKRTDEALKKVKEGQEASVEAA
jgi:hypothetical protein